MNKALSVISLVVVFSLSVLLAESNSENVQKSGAVLLAQERPPLPFPFPQRPARQESQPGPVQPSQPEPAKAQPQATPQAQEQPAPPPQPAQQPVPQQPFQAAPSQPAPKKGDVSFNFDDADVFSVIQTVFGDILKVNYIVDSRVKGRVNFRSVAPVAKEDVLPLMEVILRLNGIGIVEEGGLYRIVPISDISKEPSSVGVGREAEKVQITGKAMVQVVPVRYIQSSEMARVLSPFLSANAVIIDMPKSNHIIIADTDANIKRLLQLVEIFDNEKLKQVTPQVFVYPVQNSKAKDVAALLQQIFLGAKSAAKASTAPKTPASAQPGQPVPPQQPQAMPAGESMVSETTRIIPDEITNSIIILATPEDYAIMADTIRQIDIVSRQVVIEGLIVRVDLLDNLSFGFSWSLNTDVNITNIKPFKRDINLSGNIASVPAGMTLGTDAGNGFTFVGSDPSGVVRARVNAALKDSKAKILAAPHILVSDNREARIQVGSQVPIATSQTTTPLGGTTPTNTTTSTIQYKDIGIILKVKPQVNDSGLVSLDISQEVSSIGDTVDVAGSKNITINKTEATTNLVAQDGETIIIGGLIREDASKSKDGIPLLSKIPIIGALFSNTTDSSTRTELIILLTPHVVKNQKEAGDVTSDYVNKFKGTTKDEQIDEFIKERGQKKQDSEGAANMGKGNTALPADHIRP